MFWVWYRCVKGQQLSDYLDAYVTRPTFSTRDPEADTSTVAAQRYTNRQGYISHRIDTDSPQTLAVAVE